MHRRPSTNITRFTSISANGFYTLTRTGLLNTADSDAADSIPCEELRVLAADEKAMAELYAQTELLQTATQPKRLVVYKEYLLWFRDLQADEPRVPDPSSSHQKGSNAAEALTACSTSKVGSPKRRSAVLEGYANIRGMYVESNHSTKTNRPNKPAVGHSDVYFLKFLKTANSLIQEVLFFPKHSTLGEWRKNISNLLVVFQDFHLKYEIEEMTHNAVDSEDLSVYQVMCKSVYNMQDNKEVSSLSNAMLRRAEVMLALKDSPIDPGFKELHFDGNKFLLLIKNHECGSLTEFIKEFVFLEDLPSDKERKQIILNVFIHLSGLTHIMIKHGIVCKLSKENILVKKVLLRKSWAEILKQNEEALPFTTQFLHTLADASKSRTGLDVQSFFFVTDFTDATIVKSDDGEGYSQQQIIDLNTQLSQNVYTLGHIFYELAYGICLVSAAYYPETMEGEFARNMMQKPDKYISQRTG